MTVSRHHETSDRDRLGDKEKKREMDAQDFHGPWAGRRSGRPGSPGGSVRRRASRQGFPHVWLCGYEPRDVRVRSVSGGASVLITGTCLATEAEIDQTLRAAALGGWDALAAAGPGSYLTVLAVDSETIVFGDLAGAVLVYYTVRDGELVWATASDPLREYAGAQPDLDLLALTWSSRGSRHTEGRLRLIGSRWSRRGTCCASASMDTRLSGGTSRRRAPRSRRPPDRIGSAVSDGVARRARRVPLITGDLGGTDSAALVALAARDVPTIALTYVDDETSGDLEHGQRVVDSVPLLSWELLRRDASMDGYTGINTPDALPRADLPSLAVLSWPHESALLDHARRTGSIDHLIGVGGDEALTSGPETLPLRLRAGRVGSAIGGAIELAREDRGSATRAMVALLAAAGSSYQRSLQHAAGAIRSRAVDPEQALAMWELLDPVRPTFAAGWLTQTAAERIGQRTAALAQERQPWDIQRLQRISVSGGAPR